MKDHKDSIKGPRKGPGRVRGILALWGLGDIGCWGGGDAGSKGVGALVCRVEFSFGDMRLMVLRLGHRGLVSGA